MLKLLISAPSHSTDMCNSYQIFQAHFKSYRFFWGFFTQRLYLFNQLRAMH